MVNGNTYKMENLSLRDKWLIYRRELLKEHPELKENDLNYEFSNEEELLIQLQEKLGKTKKEIKNWLQFLG